MAGDDLLKTKYIRASPRLTATLMHDKITLGVKSLEDVIWFFREEALKK